MGEVKTVNVVMVGALSRFLPIDEAVCTEVIESRVPERFRQVNLQAFAAGREASK
ncbi:MAG TPA: 2-oxoacid:acceptor oxidoreductase family protein [Desulfopila sp.]|nr:2-oxoacid:acceptor oxidoreductase family protein [Desulfopila sp.]